MITPWKDEPVSDQLTDTHAADSAPLFLTISEVAQLLGVSPMTVRRRVQAGAWPSGRCGGQHLILREFVDAVVDEVRAGNHPDFDEFATQWFARAGEGSGMSAERPTYNIRLIPWEHGFEVHVDGVGVTQAHNRNEVEEMARDFIATDLDVPAESFDLVVAEGSA